MKKENFTEYQRQAFASEAHFKSAPEPAPASATEAMEIRCDNCDSALEIRALKRDEAKGVLIVSIEPCDCVIEPSDC